MGGYQLVLGDCREAMRAMAPESVDTIITDPPYHLTQVSRGGSARSNGGAGPFGRHRVGETGFMGKTWDGGGIAFDPATWAECLRVLKPGGRMLAFGGSRTHHRIWCAIEDAGFVIEDTIMWLYGSGFPKHKSKLKPAVEPICVARKGGASELNIDEARIDPGARWPANVALDAEAAIQLDEQSGLRHGSHPAKRTSGFWNTATGGTEQDKVDLGWGGASRFYFTSKASRTERNFGLPASGEPAVRGGATPRDTELADWPARNGNHHPTVKPVDLMRWLVRLTSRAGELVLDPFTGSGTTGIACMEEGRRFIGVELSSEYIEIARRRIGSVPPSLFSEVSA